MRTLLALAASLVLVATSAQAQTRTTPSPHELADRNDNGYVDRREYMGRVVEGYYFADVDKDGKLTIVEVRKVVKQVDPANFKAADVDKDGKLSMNEYQDALAEDFDAADKNDDGQLSKMEMKVME